MSKAYADAYAVVTSQHKAVIVSRNGRLGDPNAPGDPSAAIELLREYLQRVQTQLTPVPVLPGQAQLAPAPLVPLPAPLGQDQWVVVDSTNGTQEHARWIDAEVLEEILSEDLQTDVVRSSELRSKNTAEQLRSFLLVPATFVAVVSDDRRFEYLVRRDVVVDQVAKGMAS